MIDIHTHILNNVDDGSDSLENTINILKKAEKAGFSDIILTPHYIEGYYENKSNIIYDKIQNLKKEIYDQNILITIHHGNEILLTENTKNLLEKMEISTLANSRYILFELPFSNRILNLENIIYNIKLLGFIPILAHPERYMYIQEKPEEIKNILDSGVYIQSNYGSFIGKYGKSAKQTAEFLLKQHLISFMGTDTHKQGYEYDEMVEILKKMKNICGNEKYIEKITTINPKNILEDLDME